MAEKKIIPEALTREALAEQIWEVVNRRNVVDRTIAIEALEDILNTLRIDEESDVELGFAPKKGKPS